MASGREAPCLGTVLGHVSVREYLDEPLPREDVKRILEAARRAPTAWNMQPITVTVVEDPGRKERIARAVGGQDHVAKAPLFLVFSVDFAKIIEASRRLGVEPAKPNPAFLLDALLGAGISSASAAIAAEAMGYGVVFIALYVNPCEVADAIEAPAYVLPVVGLAVGKPLETPAPRPRQPLEAFASTDAYGDPGEKARLIIGEMGERLAKLYSKVISTSGYYSGIGGAIAGCLEKKGFRLKP